MTIPYLAGAVGGLLACLHLGGANLGVERMLEFFAIVGLGGVHIASVISAGLLLSILFQSSAAALGASLMCWLVAVVLVPSASPYVGQVIIGERRADIDGAVERLRRTSDEELTGLVDKWSRERGVDRKSWRESDEIFELHRAYESKVDAEVSRLRESHRNHLFRLLRVTMRATEISPSGLYRSTSMDLAGVGEDTERRFLRAILRFQCSLVGLCGETGCADPCGHHGNNPHRPGLHHGYSRTFGSRPTGVHLRQATCRREAG